MDVNRPGPGCSRCRDDQVRSRRVVLEQFAQDGAADVPERRRRGARFHGRQPPPLAGERRAPDREHAAVDAEQVLVAHEPLDAVGRAAERLQLAGVDHVVLARGVPRECAEGGHHPP
jgi:hypothetical protein